MQEIAIRGGGPGLRERKRVETRRRIADAALDLALELGLDGATVEAISAAAEVSPRTFFNYFDSKDEALLGMHDVRDAGVVVAEVLATTDGLTLRQVAVRLLVERVGTAVVHGGRRDERHELLHRHPHLFAAAIRRISDAQDTFAAALRDVAQERDVLGGADPAWADVLLAAAAGATRVAMREWTVAEQTAPADQIEERANALLLQAWENLK
jgi:AcrR family transcriptional regulator